MLEELLSGLKGDALGAINDNQDIPNEKIGDIMDIIGNVTKDHVAKEATSSSDGIGNLMNLFSNNDNNSNANSLQGNIMNSVVTGLVEKAGLSHSAAQMATKTILPMVLDKITSRNNETSSDDTSPLMDIFGSVLSGGNSKGGGIMDALSGFLK